MSQGFTLIELLIVIGVLGILASGLLAAVDPFEQLKKARDANNRNASVETLNALTRYYATHGVLPWQSTVVTCITGGVGAVFDPLRVSESGYPHAVVKIANTTSTDYTAAVNGCITDSVLADGELKSAFFSGLSTTLYLGSGSNTTAIVCYAPEGKALRNDTVAVQWSINAAGNSVAVGCTTAQKDAGECLQCFE
ncbi:hypothetical protein A3A84_02335 [Candidatus Collierbacteria bacterium RIFCSPLOWO2_01_FULL_50_23]|uniref:Type II secretion system protein GspG C-terminal domain-containing protein n=1 Tax=Candidatus Collierbacteria bacterium RIFCSPHIGHO2_01_FULL_50_25 TaxID=1817722 RepID=A0A1F5EUV4_9BACT|nr:MAG: hypothetical protein A2703_02300 [Candidatus Collierbacteria bacterium RIFCSPHIGHO2_01_FULL_50_25]OGD73797.1 MAG: hypothetical protein A3A84_02335 [Candidatus Collierbacteria bacterium RIFCSPLOWO2_01_FULL_50_23]